MRLAVSAAIAALTLLSGPVAAQNLVTNPGFETGSFSGWTQGGNLHPAEVSANIARTGTYGALFGFQMNVGTLSQSISTTPGASYLFSFWLRNVATVGGLVNPNSFEVLWGGTTLGQSTNATAFGYTLYSYHVAAPAAATTIEFRFLHDPWYWHLDDVGVTAVETDVVPEPATMTLLATGLAGVAAARRRKRATS